MHYWLHIRCLQGSSQALVGKACCRQMPRSFCPDFLSHLHIGVIYHTYFSWYNDTSSLWSEVFALQTNIPGLAATARAMKRTPRNHTFILLICSLQTFYTEFDSDILYKQKLHRHRQRRKRKKHDSNLINRNVILRCLTKVPRHCRCTKGCTLLVVHL